VHIFRRPAGHRGRRKILDVAGGTKMTTTSGCADTIRRVASMPLISGMLMSISTRAG